MIVASAKGIWRQAWVKAFVEPDDICRQIRDVINAMRCPEGGLMLMVSIHGANLLLISTEAICEVMVDCCFR